MGIQDRQYYRDESQYLSVRPTSAEAYSMVTIIIAINVAVHVISTIFGDRIRPGVTSISELLLLTPDSVTNPKECYRLLTAGFAHSSMGIGHLAGNMMSLFFLGRFVEQRYGRFEFLRIYLVAIVLGNVVWAFLHYGNPYATALGASGAVSTIILLFVLNYPNATMMFGIKAWMMGIGIIVMNLFSLGPENVAYDIHLTGLAFAAAYFYLGWNFGNLTSFFSNAKKKMSQPKLRIHHPDDDPETTNRNDDEADRILEKLHRDGEASLSKRERKILEDYSRRMRDKRN